MISIFHKEVTGVEFHSSSHKAQFCFILNTLIKSQGNIIIANRFSESCFQEENGYFRFLH